MVRIPPERGVGARMEIRLGDATANPYLAMAAVRAAAYLGIQDKTEPPWPWPGVRAALPAFAVSGALPSARFLLLSAPEGRCPKIADR